MKNLDKKIILITGATAGIGKAIAYTFAEAGANLIITGRRDNLLDIIKRDIENKFNVKVMQEVLDVRDRIAVEKFVSDLDEFWCKIDILVNNAGLGRGLNKLYEDEPSGWDEMIDTNVKGLLNVTKSVVSRMVERGSGHIINIGSIAGHEAYGKGAVYCSTKHAVNAITKSLRIDLIDKNIRVSTIDPGMVETEFSKVRFYGDEQKAKNVYKGLQPLTPEDVAESVLFVATRPMHVNINELVIMPSVQANAFITHREQ